MNLTRINTYELSFLLNSKTYVFQNYMVNVIKFFRNGWGFLDDLTESHFLCCSQSTFLQLNKNGNPQQFFVSNPHGFLRVLYLSFTDTLRLLEPLFYPFLYLSQTSLHCMDPICTEIKSFFFFSFFLYFYKKWYYLATTKKFSNGLGIFERLLYIREREKIIYNVILYYASSHTFPAFSVGSFIAEQI